MIRHRLASLLAATFILAISAACTSQADDNNTAKQQPRLLTVSGHGEARHAPDMSTISAGVRTQAANRQGCA